MDILNTIANTSISFYFEKTLNKLICYFSSDEKNDIVAYLLDDMSWDVREIISEHSVLNETSENITINHKPVSLEKPDSQFDNVIRKYINGVIEAEENNSTFDKIKNILANNSYGSDE